MRMRSAFPGAAGALAASASTARRVGTQSRYRRGAVIARRIRGQDPGGFLMRDALRQLSTAFRSLSRQPAVMLPAVLTLALGIGANTALFAYLAAILWPTIDAPHFE